MPPPPSRIFSFFLPTPNPLCSRACFSSFTLFFFFSNIIDPSLTESMAGNHNIQVPLFSILLPCLGKPYMLLALGSLGCNPMTGWGASVYLTYEPHSLMTKSSLWDFLGLWEVRLTTFASIKARTTHSANLGKIPSMRALVWILVSLLLLNHYKIKILMPSQVETIS